MVQRGSRRGIALALGVLWLVWGSTYLAGAWALTAVPPFVLSAGRFALAAALAGGAAALTGAPRPSRQESGSAGIVGLFLFLGGNGGTTWAQTRVPSGLAAVLVGMVPLWLVILGFVVEGERPGLRRVAGVLLGLSGVAGLAGGVGEGRIDPIGVAVVFGATFSWASGSMLARRLPLPDSVAWSVAIQMAAGSVALAIAALVTGQVWQVHPERVDARVVASFAWLVLGGSVMALVAYNWLLRATSAAIASTYAYVNPLVALWLGVWLGGERLTPWQLGCSGLIVAAVALVAWVPPAIPAGVEDPP